MWRRTTLLLKFVLYTMRLLISLFFCLLNLVSYAQPKDWNTWYFGVKLGIDFNNGSTNILSNSTLAANYGAACQSYPSDGTYMMFTDGRRIFSKDFQPIPGGFLLDQPVFSFIVPDPAKPLNYYVFVVDNSNEIHYLHVDHSNPSKVGAIDQGDKLLRTNADHHFTAVKRLYDAGYWLITHTRGTDEFLVYAITKTGVSSVGMSSNTGKATSSTNSYVYGNMVSDKKGTRILHCFSRRGEGSYGELFTFDKQCGTLSLSKTLDVGSSAYACQGIFSLNDQYIYVAPGIRQFDPNDPGPLLSGTYVQNSGSGPYAPKMALAPNGILYLSRGDNGNVSPKVCTIEGANTANPVFFYDKVNLNTNSDYRYVENFPMFIMDWTIPSQDPNYPLPSLAFNGTCLENPTDFSVIGIFLYDSLSWDFGDGNTSIQKNPTYQYSQVSTYEVQFHWYLCGQDYTLSQTISVGAIPTFSLGADTVLCAGTEFNLKGPSSINSYLWNDGTTKANMLITESGLYWLKAGIAQCFGFDSIYITFRPDVLVELGTGFHLCPYDSQLVRIDAGKGFEEYRWTPTGDTTHWIDVKIVGDYYVVVRDFYGCPGNDGTTVERRCPVFLELPNAFTPNADGINDAFFVVANDVVAMDLKIFNRWGAEIYHSQNMTDTWDGTIKGIPVPDGVYVVVLSYSGYEDGQLKRFNRRVPLHVLR